MKLNDIVNHNGSFTTIFTMSSLVRAVFTSRALLQSVFNVFKEMNIPGQIDFWHDGIRIQVRNPHWRARDFRDTDCGNGGGSVVSHLATDILYEYDFHRETPLHLKSVNFRKIAHVIDKLGDDESIEFVAKIEGLIIRQCHREYENCYFIPTPEDSCDLLPTVTEFYDSGFPVNINVPFEILKTQFEKNQLSLHDLITVGVCPGDPDEMLQIEEHLPGHILSVLKIKTVFVKSPILRPVEKPECVEPVWVVSGLLSVFLSAVGISPTVNVRISSDKKYLVLRCESVEGSSYIEMVISAKKNTDDE